MKTLSILAVAVTLLTGCAGTVYRTDLEVYCPPIVSYDESFSSRLADEIEALPTDNYAIDMAITDYAKLRNRIRACEKEKEKL